MNICLGVAWLSGFYSFVSSFRTGWAEEGGWYREGGEGMEGRTHHRWEVVEIPVGGDLDKSRHVPSLERFHPLFRFLLVVDLGPLVANA